ncbi:LapA family protein [Paratissierella segnis]|jgi:uncharacterized integral membrane protein|uniref:DUF1049 domain-containing protein n=1 Tax=Paratissierella segnis TaxID=2763679 RepID=A0A926ETB3_9FIRM|nr:lipopolysaccharide assembly protein LapA domain-containing protein [Paratissierella segnis]MBC8587087.1 DUF1049 domain-containing protein [Paratissierella segnis]
MTGRFVISLIFAVIVAIFALQNAASVTIKFFFAEFTISQALIILISAVFGAIIVLILGTIKQFKTNMKVKNLSKSTEKLEEENRELKERIEQKSNDFNNIEANNMDMNNVETNDVEINNKNEDNSEN